MKVIVASNLNKNLPLGSLLFWGGLASEIPEGWELFDSAADAFIMGTTAAGINLTKQGEVNHKHTINNTDNGGSHIHNNTIITSSEYSGYFDGAYQGIYGAVSEHSHSVTLSFNSAGGHNHSVSDTDSKEHLPKYIRYYLMKCIDATEIPINTIAIWSGRLIEIPSGWHNCDGSIVNGITLPDICGRFIYVPNNDSDKGKTGGANTHSHSSPTSVDSNTDEHSHSGTYTVSNNNNGKPSYVNQSADLYYHADSPHNHPSKSFNSASNINNHDHTLPSINSAIEILPPYIKAYYIMKVQS